jgi:hypothetical protein
VPQWNPWHQLQPEYVKPPLQFQPHASPVVVSSHPHMPPTNRAQLGPEQDHMLGGNLMPDLNSRPETWTQSDTSTNYAQAQYSACKFRSSEIFVYTQFLTAKLDYDFEHPYNVTSSEKLETNEGREGPTGRRDTRNRLRRTTSSMSVFASSDHSFETGSPQPESPDPMAFQVPTSDTYMAVHQNVPSQLYLSSVNDSQYPTLSPNVRVHHLDPEARPFEVQERYDAVDEEPPYQNSLSQNMIYVRDTHGYDPHAPLYANTANLDEAHLRTHRSLRRRPYHPRRHKR